MALIGLSANAAVKLDCDGRGAPSFTAVTKQKSFDGYSGHDWLFYDANGKPVRGSKAVQKNSKLNIYLLDGSREFDFYDVSGNEAYGEYYVENYAGRVKMGTVNCTINRK